MKKEYLIPETEILELELNLSVAQASLDSNIEELDDPIDLNW